MIDAFIQAVKNTKSIGDFGETEIVRLIGCPSCGMQLMTMPQNYPLFDVQCTACTFRAQVKTSLSKPKAQLFGAGWDIIDKVLRSGATVPPLLVNYKWTERGVKKHEVRFFPFIPQTYIKKRKLSENAKRANYWMFNYTNLDQLPYFTLFTN